jgi:hypothetical protein
MAVVGLWRYPVKSLRGEPRPNAYKLTNHLSPACRQRSMDTSNVSPMCVPATWAKRRHRS